MKVNACRRVVALASFVGLATLIGCGDPCLDDGKGKGVCGTSWDQKQTLIVPDVDAFPGHIACASQSKSEIVVPLLDDRGEVWGVLDIDSDQPDDFSKVDQDALEQLVSWLSAGH